MDGDTKTKLLEILDSDEVISTIRDSLAESERCFSEHRRIFNTRPTDEQMNMMITM